MKTFNYRHCLALLLLLVSAVGVQAQYRVNRQTISLEGGAFVTKAPVSNQTYMYIPDFTLACGDTAVVTVYLQSTVPIWMAQLHLQIPSGLKVTDAAFSDNLGEWAYTGNTNPNSLAWGMVGDELRMVTLNNGRSQAIPACTTARAVFTLKIAASSSMSPGEKTIVNNSFKFVAATSQVGEGFVGGTRNCRVNVWKPVTRITLSPTSTGLYPGYTTTPTVNFTPSDASRTGVNWTSWTSSDPTVASVSSYGVVTARQRGTVTITATNRGTRDGSPVTASCTVEVWAYATGIELNKSETQIYVSGTEQLSATVSPSYAHNRSVNWSSSNTSVATVDSYGKVTARSVGTAYIYAYTTDGSSLSAWCKVIVKGATSIELNKSEIILFKQTTETLVASLLPTELLYKTVSWSSSNTNVAVVNSYGTVTGVKEGTAVITATTTDGSYLSASCVVNVMPDYMIDVDSLTHLRGKPTTTEKVAVNLFNRNAISGLQFDVVLPHGVSMAMYDDLPDVWLNDDRKSRNHQVNVSLLEERDDEKCYRVLVSSPTNNELKGNYGTVLFMNLVLDRYHNAGDYYITYSDIVLNEPNATEHKLATYAQRVRLCYVLGDADADTRVDIADYTATALHILQRPTVRFYTDAANVNTDATINVTDLTAITNIALELSPITVRYAPAQQRTGGGCPPSQDMEVKARLTGGSQLELALCNTRAVAAMQMDLTLPDGVTVGEASLAGRAGSHQLGMATLPDGRVRLLLSAFSDADIAPGDDAVVLLQLEGQPHGRVEVDNVIATERDLTTHVLEGVTAPLGTTAIDPVEMAGGVRISVQGGDIVIESPHAGKAQLVMVNGTTRELNVKAGHNRYAMDAGCYIVRMNGTVAKLLVR